MARAVKLPRRIKPTIHSTAAQPHQATAHQVTAHTKSSKIIATNSSETTYPAAWRQPSDKKTPACSRGAAGLTTPAGRSGSRTSMTSAMAARRMGTPVARATMAMTGAAGWRRQHTATQQGGQYTQKQNASHELLHHRMASVYAAAQHPVFPDVIRAACQPPPAMRRPSSLRGASACAATMTLCALSARKGRHGADFAASCGCRHFAGL